MSVLPYITAPGNVEKALLGIKAAATPENVTQDFVKTILKIKGGSGNQVASFLKKIGFANSDGSTTDIYKRFRNSSSTGAAAFDALKAGYGALKARNEYWYKLEDDELRGLIVEETGLADDATVVTMVITCIKALKKFSTFEAPATAAVTKMDELAKIPVHVHNLPPPSNGQTIGLRLGYTINLNLPATSDVAVFNAIFKSLKENLLGVTKDGNE
jgi:Family of unknown function (DUF5343)